MSSDACARSGGASPPIAVASSILTDPHDKYTYKGLMVAAVIALVVIAMILFIMCFCVGGSGTTTLKLPASAEVSTKALEQLKQSAERTAALEEEIKKMKKDIQKRALESDVEDLKDSLKDSQKRSSRKRS